MQERRFFSTHTSFLGIRLMNKAGGGEQVTEHARARPDFLRTFLIVTFGLEERR